MSAGPDAYIGFAVRSGNALFGAESLLRARKPVYAVFCDAALGKDGRKKLAKFAERNKTEIHELPQGYLADLLKRSGVKVIGICDPNLAQAAVKTLKGGSPSDGGK